MAFAEFKKSRISGRFWWLSVITDNFITLHRGENDSEIQSGFMSPSTGLRNSKAGDIGISSGKLRKNDSGETCASSN